MTTHTFLLAPLAGNALWGAVGLLAGVVLIGFFARRKPMTVTARSVATGIILAVTLLLGWIFIGALSAKVQLEPTKLVLDLPAYSREVPIASLQLDAARVIDAKASDAPKLGFRTNGVGMPGYNLGWFRLKDSDTRALVSVTGDAPLLVIPTSDNYILVLSTPDGDKLLAALRQAVATGAAR
ncbi:PH domain-containing protein [Shewanella sp. JM162201]|uniref:PH domain-containing protein n=1 Tax=Shewanella jiangmenensis TaxID=2837387 RepID=A0ABS5V955_9GAMM|nr:PH domain-containing protein [Shewanella jiangmenensis]MBT1446528.1 PH domain-containing protein [Shewanella jiangmenensis]